MFTQRRESSARIVNFMKTMNEMPDCPYPPVSCVCYKEEAHMPCVCGMSERALRAWSGGVVEIEPMTPEQREWCLSEIDSVEGYARKDYEASDDGRLARGVLSAWHDYCRDKGL